MADDHKHWSQLPSSRDTLWPILLLFLLQKAAREPGNTWNLFHIWEIRHSWMDFFAIIFVVGLVQAFVSLLHWSQFKLTLFVIWWIFLTSYSLAILVIQAIDLIWSRLAVQLLLEACSSQLRMSNAVTICVWLQLEGHFLITNSNIIQSESSS